MNAEVLMSSDASRNGKAHTEVAYRNEFEMFPVLEFYVNYNVHARKHD